MRRKLRVCQDCGRMTRNEHQRCDICTYHYYEPYWHGTVNVPSNSPYMKAINAVMFGALCLFLISIGEVRAEAVYGTASWYSTEACRYNPDPKCPMANGESLYEAIKKEEPYSAIWGVPFGQRLRVTNIRNGKSTNVIVKDRGPNKRLKRVIDISRESFSKIADPNDGIIQVKVEVIHDKL